MKNLEKVLVKGNDYAVFVDKNEGMLVFKTFIRATDEEIEDGEAKFIMQTSEPICPEYVKSIGDMENTLDYLMYVSNYNETIVTDDVYAGFEKCLQRFKSERGDKVLRNTDLQVSLCPVMPVALLCDSNTPETIYTAFRGNFDVDYIKYRFVVISTEYNDKIGEPSRFIFVEASEDFSFCSAYDIKSMRKYDAESTAKICVELQSTISSLVSDESFEELGVFLAEAEENKNGSEIGLLTLSNFMVNGEIQSGASFNYLHNENVSDFLLTVDTIKDTENELINKSIQSYTSGVSLNLESMSTYGDIVTALINMKASLDTTMNSKLDRFNECSKIRFKTIEELSEGDYLFPNNVDMEICRVKKALIKQELGIDIVTSADLDSIDENMFSKILPYVDVIGAGLDRTLFGTVVDKSLIQIGETSLGLGMSVKAIDGDKDGIRILRYFSEDMIAEFIK